MTLQALGPVDRLLLALTFDNSKVTDDLVNRAAGTDIAKGSLGVLVLNEAARLTGKCPDSVSKSTASWLDQVAAGGAGGGGGIWSLFAIHAARVCLGAGESTALQKARSNLGNVIASLPAGESTHGDLMLTWLRTIATCLEINSGDPPMTPAQVSDAQPRTFSEILDSGAVSIMDLVVQAYLLHYPEARCRELGWITR
jgi:hypothetical protein